MLTIYECPGCGGQRGNSVLHECVHCGDTGAALEVRVFREEDVRPLWDESRMWSHRHEAFAAFPAPEEWWA